MEDKNNSNGKFSYGFLLSIPAWIVSSFLCSLVPSLLNMNEIPKGQLLINVAEGTLFIAGFTLVIWIPLAIIAGNISRKREKKSVKWFVAASFFISLLVVGGCFGLLSFS